MTSLTYMLKKLALRKHELMIQKTLSVKEFVQFLGRKLGVTRWYVCMYGFILGCMSLIFLSNMMYDKQNMQQKLVKIQKSTRDHKKDYLWCHDSKKNWVKNFLYSSKLKI